MSLEKVLSNIESTKYWKYQESQVVTKNGGLECVFKATQG